MSTFISRTVSEDCFFGRYQEEQFLAFSFHLHCCWRNSEYTLTLIFLTSFISKVKYDSIKRGDGKKKTHKQNLIKYELKILDANLFVISDGLL